MSPATHALDRRLYDLRSAYDAAVGSLADLDAQDIFSVLTTGHGFSGLTHHLAEPALARLADLRPCVGALGDTLDGVFDERTAGQMDDRRAAELVAWLNSATIMVPPSAPRPVDRPLVTAPAGAEFLSPRGLLEALEEVVAELRRLLADVEAAWEGFSDRHVRVAGQADALAAELPGNRALATARADLELLDTRVVGDPMGALELLERAESVLSGAADLREESRPLHDRLAGCRRLAERIESAVVAGRHGLDRSRAEFVAPAGMLAPIDPAVLDGERGLRPWLGRLERLVNDGEVGLATTGLERWQAVAEQTLAAAEQVAEANSGPTRRRRELQGLLRAARVKAGASGRAEDAWATELADRAEAALAIPCDLAQAEAQVEAFLEDLRLTPTPAQGGGSRPARARARAEHPGHGPAPGAGHHPWGMSA